MLKKKKRKQPKLKNKIKIREHRAMSWCSLLGFVSSLILMVTGRGGVRASPDLPPVL